MTDAAALAWPVLAAQAAPPLPVGVQGLLGVFGSLAVGLALGALLGWAFGFERGLTAGLACLGVGGLVGAGRVMLEQGQRVRVAAVAAHCEPAPAGWPAWAQQVQWWQAVDAPQRRWPVASDRSACPVVKPGVRQFLSVPRAAVPGRLPWADEAADPRQPWQVAGALAAFGLFGSLGAGVILSWSRPAVPRPPPPPGSGRARAAGALPPLAFTLMAGGLLAARVWDGPLPQRVALALAGVPPGCVAYAAAMALRRQHVWPAYFLFALLASVFGLAVAALLTLA